MDGRTQPDLVTCYRISCERCQIIEGGEPVIRDLTGTLVESEHDSMEIRRGILQKVAERFCLVRPLPLSSIELKSVVPSSFAPETQLSLAKPLPAARAKVVIVRTYGSSAELDECIAFEERLDRFFSGSEVGFVDGNELGGGEYAIFLHGPRKAPLLEAVRHAIGDNMLWSIRK